MEHEERMAEDTKYQEYFRKKLDDGGYKSPNDIPEDKRKAWYEEVDKGWKADEESDESSSDYSEMPTMDDTYDGITANLNSLRVGDSIVVAKKKKKKVKSKKEKKKKVKSKKEKKKKKKK